MYWKVETYYSRTIWSSSPSLRQFEENIPSSFTREDTVYFLQCIASNEIFCTCRWSCESLVVKDTLINRTHPNLSILVFHQLPTIKPTVQNIPLKTMHCGKYLVSSLNPCNSTEHRNIPASFSKKCPIILYDAHATGSTEISHF